MRSRYCGVMSSMLAMLLVLGGSGALAPIWAQQIHLDLVQPTTGVPDKLATGWPGSYSAWQELYPTLGNLYAQEGRIDNDDDGQVTFNDYIRLRLPGGDGIWYRIVWAGPSYFATPGGGGDQHAFEPLLENAPMTGPVGEIWRRVLPSFGANVTVTGWVDTNGNSETDAGDEVTIDGTAYLIDRVSLDIILEEGEPIPAENRTWGQIKALF